MAFHHQTTAVPRQNASSAILERFIDPLDCLTAHLMLECSEVLAGVKPANLVSLVNRLRPCGRNLYQLRQSHHQLVVIRLGNIAFLLLKTRERAASGNHKALELDNPEHPFFCHDIDTDIQYRRGYNP